MTLIDEAEALLNCPFCGGEAERIELDDGDNAGGDVICCTKCQASSHVEFGRKENLVAAWNRRAALPARGVGVPTEATAIRHSFDGYGWQYIDAGSGSDWTERGMAHPDAEPLYSRIASGDEIARLAREIGEIGRDLGWHRVWERADAILAALAPTDAAQAREAALDAFASLDMALDKIDAMRRMERDDYSDAYNTALDDAYDAITRIMAETRT